VRRSAKAGDPAFDEMRTTAELDALLPETDLLVMALPNTPDTANILSRERMALLPRSAYVINVGRGTAIDQEALIEALDSGRLAGAALDVVVPEPLPADHPLRRAKNLLLTPHVAGNMTLAYTQQKSVDMFLSDLENYVAGKPLEHAVDRRRMY
jgi:phosphoglycerate dehydrogenase-like enzyme